MTCGQEARRVFGVRRSPWIFQQVGDDRKSGDDLLEPEHKGVASLLAPSTAGVLRSLRLLDVNNKDDCECTNTLSSNTLRDGPHALCRRSGFGW